MCEVNFNGAGSPILVHLESLGLKSSPLYERSSNVRTLSRRTRTSLGRSGQPKSALTSAGRSRPAAHGFAANLDGAGEGFGEFLGGGGASALELEEGANFRGRA